MAKSANRADDAETPVNAAKFTMARDCMRRHFRLLLIGTYKHLILEANLAVSDFRGGLLHGCTAARYKFLLGGARASEKSISGQCVSFEPNTLTATLNHRCGATSSIEASF
jgi:hypothetical protein